MLIRSFILTISIINAVSAFVCGILLIAAPDGSLMAAGELLIPIATFPLAHIFFQDLLWIGIAMLLVLCIPNTVAATLLIRRHALQYHAVILANILVMTWCSFQFIYMFNWLAVIYFLLGLLMVLGALFLIRHADRTHF